MEELEINKDVDIIENKCNEFLEKIKGSHICRKKKEDLDVNTLFSLFNNITCEKVEEKLINFLIDSLYSCTMCLQTYYKLKEKCLNNKNEKSFEIIDEKRIKNLVKMENPVLIVEILNFNWRVLKNREISDCFYSMVSSYMTKDNLQVEKLTFSFFLLFFSDDTAVIKCTLNNLYEIFLQNKCYLHGGLNEWNFLIDKYDCLNKDTMWLRTMFYYIGIGGNYVSKEIIPMILETYERIENPKIQILIFKVIYAILNFNESWVGEFDKIFKSILSESNYDCLLKNQIFPVRQEHFIFWNNIYIFIDSFKYFNKRNLLREFLSFFNDISEEFIKRYIYRTILEQSGNIKNLEEFILYFSFFEEFIILYLRIKDPKNFHLYDLNTIFVKKCVNLVYTSITSILQRKNIDLEVFYKILVKWNTIIININKMEGSKVLNSINYIDISQLGGFLLLSFYDVGGDLRGVINGNKILDIFHKLQFNIKSLFCFKEVFGLSNLDIEYKTYAYVLDYKNFENDKIFLKVASETLIKIIKKIKGYYQLNLCFPPTFNEFINFIKMQSPISIELFEIIFSLLEFDCYIINLLEALEKMINKIYENKDEQNFLANCCWIENLQNVKYQKFKTHIEKLLFKILRYIDSHSLKISNDNIAKIKHLMLCSKIFNNCSINKLITCLETTNSGETKDQNLLDELDSKNIVKNELKLKSVTIKSKESFNDDHNLTQSNEFLQNKINENIVDLKEMENGNFKIQKINERQNSEEKLILEKDIINSENINSDLKKESIVHAKDSLIEDKMDVKIIKESDHNTSEEIIIIKGEITSDNKYPSENDYIKEISYNEGNVQTQKLSSTNTTHLNSIHSQCSPNETINSKKDNVISAWSLLEQKNTECTNMRQVNKGETLSNDIEVKRKINRSIQLVTDEKKMNIDMGSALIPPRNKIQKLSKTIVDMSKFLIEVLNENHQPIKHDVKIPTFFSSHNHYVSIFEPLVIEECHSQIKKAMNESNSSGFQTAEINEICHINNFIELQLVSNNQWQLQEHDLLQFEDFRGVVVSNQVKSEQKLYYLKVRTNENIKKPFLKARIRYKLIANLSTTYREFYALHSFKDSNIANILLSPVKITEKDLFSNFELSKIMSIFKINHQQAEAVLLAKNTKREVSLIQGPPGTGKTKTIVALASAFLSQRSNFLQSYGKPKILICAPSNTAVDEITRRLGQGINTLEDKFINPNIIRIGISEHMDVDIKKYSLDYLVEQMKKDNVNINRDFYKLKLSLIESCDIICSTLSSSAQEVLLNSKISVDALIVDEACQCVEISTLIPLRLSPKKIILVGDPKQLPPTVMSQMRPYERSLFQRLENFYDVTLLKNQYRMDPCISWFPNKYFYENKLKNDESLLERFNPYKHALCSVAFFNVNGSENSYCSSISFHNSFEEKEIHSLILFIFSKINKDQLENKIGIITPYKLQVEKIRKSIKSSFGNDIFNYVEINTVDAFQGKEKDIIIISCVRTKYLGFVSDIRRMNVAITRAKHCLFIFGNSNLLKTDRVWNELIFQFRKKKLYYDGINSYLKFKK